MMTLYEINQRYEQVLAEAMTEAEEHDGEIPNDLAIRLDVLEEEADKKIANCGRYYKNRLAEAEAIDAEITKLRMRRMRAQNAAEWIKRYVAGSIPAGRKYSDSALSISWMKSTETVIDDLAKLPESYIRTKIEKSPDKMAIKDAISSGTEVPGAHIEEKQNILIK